MQDAATLALKTLAPGIEISVNGEPRRVPAGSSVCDLLDVLGLDRRKVAIECNEAIVPRSLYGGTSLQTGDRLEIVHFIGGG